MYTIKNKIFPVLIAGILSGGILSIVFINPYDGRILVSEAILQLSGSSGAFPLTPAFKDLISFTIRMIPDYMFELLLSTMFRECRNWQTEHNMQKAVWRL